MNVEWMAVVTDVLKGVFCSTCYSSGFVVSSVFYISKKRAGYVLSLLVAGCLNAVLAF